MRANYNGYENAFQRFNSTLDSLLFGIKRAISNAINTLITGEHYE